MGGKINVYSLLWQALSSDNWIHEVVSGKILEFDTLPVQESLPRPLHLSITDQKALDSAMLHFIKHKIVESCEPLSEQCFYS